MNADKKEVNQNIQEQRKKLSKTSKEFREVMEEGENAEESPDKSPLLPTGNLKDYIKKAVDGDFVW